MGSNARTSHLNPSEQVQRVDGEVGRYGGRLSLDNALSLRPSIRLRRQIGVARNNRALPCGPESASTGCRQQTEPGLAQSWKTSPDRRNFTLKLRKGIRFSDGHPFDADDVVFSFTLYLDEAVNSPAA